VLAVSDDLCVEERVWLESLAMREWRPDQLQLPPDQKLLGSSLQRGC
jgi:hypothetical protein